MSGSLIDDLNSLEDKKVPKIRGIRIVSLVLALCFLVFGFLLFPQIFQAFSYYIVLRLNMILWFGLNAAVIAISLSFLPVIAARAVVRSERKASWKNYLKVLSVVLFLYLFFLIAGLEIIFSLPKGSNSQPFLPSYAFIPPFPYSFDLLFVFSVVLTSLTARFLFRKRFNHTSNK